MTSKLDPQELERLLTRYEKLVGRHYRGTLEVCGQAAKYEADLRFAADLRDKLRTGQLVPAMPSGDVVEAVALGMAAVIANRHGHAPEDWLSDARREEARAAITTYEAVSGVAKMRDASKTFAQMMEGWGPEYFPARIVTDYESTASAYDIRWEDIEALRAALGEKP